MMTCINPPALLVFLIIIGIDTTESGISPEEWLQDPSNLQHLIKEHFGLLTIYLFIFSFFIAAGVEELVKYFIWWSTETPDVLGIQDLADNEIATSNTAAVDDSKVRQARATTIAMIAVSTGFAWNENLLYVWQQQTLWNQFCVLMLRSIFPVHELCAAIQSVGVVHRDIEGNKKWQLGRIILPAVFLHGLFDFILFLWTIWNSLIKKSDDSGGTDNQFDPSATPEDIKIGENLLSLSLCLPLILAGAWYYCLEARKQRRRLQLQDGMDSCEESDSYPPPSSDIVHLDQRREGLMEGGRDTLSAPLLVNQN